MKLRMQFSPEMVDFVARHFEYHTTLELTITNLDFENGKAEVEFKVL